MDHIPLLAWHSDILKEYMIFLGNNSNPHCCLMGIKNVTLIIKEVGYDSIDIFKLISFLIKTR